MLYLKQGWVLFKIEKKDKDKDQHYMLHTQNLMFLALVVTCIMNYYLKWFNVKTLICMSIILKIVIFILERIFIFFSLSTIIIYVLLYLLIFYGFIRSNEKKKSIYKLIFLILFWSVFTMIFIVLFNDYSIILNVIDSSMLKNFLSIFLVNYIINDIDYFSDLTPSNSKYILDVLHNLLKNINKDLFPSGGGGGGLDPEILPYAYLCIDKNEKSNITSFWPDMDINLDSILTKIISAKLDYHNKNLVYPKLGEMLVEKNKMISYNNYLDYYFHSPYDLASFGWENNKNISDFLPLFKQEILREIEQYNKYILCKFYYENDNKDSLPSIFKSFWREWHLSQIASPDRYLELMRKNPNFYISNFIKEDVAYRELNDNILIIGVGILCKVYIYANLYTDYNPDFNVSKVKFYTKAWEYYIESICHYSSFFKHYNWYCKLYELEHFTKSNIWYKLWEEGTLRAEVASIPALHNDILNLPVKPTWDNTIRPNALPKYKEISLYKLGLTVHKVYLEWDNKHLYDFFFYHDCPPADASDFTKKVWYKIFAKPKSFDFEKKLKPYVSPYYNDPQSHHYKKDVMSLKFKSPKEIRDDLYNEPFKIKDFFLYRWAYIHK